MSRLETVAYHAKRPRCTELLSAAAQPNLFAYVRSTWNDSTLWPPAAWSVYNRPVCTNNDLEGWHFCLNAKAKKDSLPLYVLVSLLHREAVIVNWQVKMLSEGKVLRRWRARQHNVEARLHALWRMLQQASSVRASCYAAAVSYMYAPDV